MPIVRFLSQPVKSVQPADLINAWTPEWNWKVHLRKDSYFSYIHNTFDLLILAIREDRTRGGRSTYQCSYTLPANLTSSQNSSANNGLPIQTSLRMESEEEETNAEGINSTSIAIQRAQETVEESMEVNQQPSALKNVPLLIQVRIASIF